MDKYRANSRNQPWTQPIFWVIIAKTLLIVDVEAISTMLVLFYFVEIKLIQPLVGANVTRKFWSCPCWLHVVMQLQGHHFYYKLNVFHAIGYATFVKNLLQCWCMY
jgi:hypothetical protein